MYWIGKARQGPGGDRLRAKLRELGVDPDYGIAEMGGGTPMARTRVLCWAVKIAASEGAAAAPSS